MPLDFATLRTEYASTAGELETLVDTVAKANRDFTDQERADKEKKFARLEQIKGLLEDEKKLAGHQFDKGQVTPPTLPPGKSAVEGERGAEIPGGKPDKDQFNRVLVGYANTGTIDPKFATITTATASGAMLPKTITEPILATAANVFREAHDLYGLQPYTGTTTEDVTVPVVDASAGGAVAENAGSETENAPSLSDSITLNAVTYQSGSAWFSNKQIAAPDFDVIGSVLPALTYSKELGLESAAVAAIIADAGITQSVATATTAGFTYDNLVDLNRKLPKRYDRLKVIILSAAAYSAAEKLVDDNGRPILMQDPQNQELKRFNGTPVLRSDYLEAFGASKIVGIVVSMLGFRLRDVTPQTLTRYVAVPGRPNQTGLNLFAYHGYGYAKAAIASLKTPAS